MFENPKKGWHGAYSLTGKVTAEYFEQILRKEKIFNLENQKKLIIKDFFSPDTEKNNIDFLNDDVKSFQVYHKEKKHFIEKLLKSLINKNKNENKINKYKDLNSSLRNAPKKQNIYMAKDKEYQPKYDLVFAKTLTGIKWEKMSGRKKPVIDIINSNIDNNKICKRYNKEEFEIKNNYLTCENKCLVDMNKYTKRGEFIELKDIRKRYDKPFKKNVDDIMPCVEKYLSNNENIKNIQSKLTNTRKSNLELKQSFSEKIIVPDFKK